MFFHFVKLYKKYLYADKRPVMSHKSYRIPMLEILIYICVSP